MNKDEPVAWGMKGEDGLIFDVICPDEHAREAGSYTIPLYTTPQQRTWVGLTYEEMQEILIDPKFQLKPLIAHAVEAKLKEKNT